LAFLKQVADLKEAPAAAIGELEQLSRGTSHVWHHNRDEAASMACSDAVGAVLEHKRARRVCAKALSGEKKDVRVRL